MILDDNTFVAKFPRLTVGIVAAEFAGFQRHAMRRTIVGEISTSHSLSHPAGRDHIAESTGQIAERRRAACGDLPKQVFQFFAEMGDIQFRGRHASPSNGIKARRGTPISMTCTSPVRFEAPG